MEIENVKAWVVTADMGLGHQRAAFPLEFMAEGGIITAGDPEVTDPSEARLWKGLRSIYELASRTKGIPLAGSAIFGMMNNMLKIPTIYPLRDLSHAGANNRIVDYFIKRGLGQALLRKMNTKPLPMVSTFYAPALAADHYKYLPIYSVICDADLNRVWVATKPHESRISYFAPCGRVMRRLREYGIPDERIFITGFPLPLENIGSPQMEILKADLLGRLIRLDPRGKFRAVFGPAVENLLGPANQQSKASGPITVTFAVGGAGAQTDIGLNLARSFKKGILEGQFNLILIAGVNSAVKRCFDEYLASIGLDGSKGNGVDVIFEKTKPAYFRRFNEAMRKTDILWTKPSELSFYSALGIPIIMAPTIGAQEDKNLKWLSDKACAMPQYNPEYAAEWLADMIGEGILAEKAFNGFIKNRKLGVYKIAEVLASGTMSRESHPLKR